MAPLRFEHIAPIPTSDDQDLAGWMKKRNCELRTAMECGDPVLVVKTGCLVGQDASVRSSTLGRDLPEVTRQTDVPYDEMR